MKIFAFSRHTSSKRSDTHPRSLRFEDTFVLRSTKMSAASRKYSGLRRKLYQAWKARDFDLVAAIRNEMAKTWNELEKEEKYTADTCPGTPIPVPVDDDPFCDAT